ncbi:family 1 glycosylhydrolase [Muricoccus aerilatus]|uniref:family 1 glycosylhydrolase n=1 Tax=Muricoccus aerilatus TaxID=452982 RepID=UPI000A9D4A0C|nr:family 1 glycosylhydrolase [Roseomonas aerilata]
MPDLLPPAFPPSPGVTAPLFLFATGIENSNPRVGERRVDQMAASGHMQRWREDFALVQEVGCNALRYGPPLHSTWLGEGRYDWAFADETFAALRHQGTYPIVDLCHFGVPDWIGDFQNPDFPRLFAGYAEAFAVRFPWVQLYTPVNEMYVCALFSGRYGWWNERMTTERGFVTALKHLVAANRLAMRAILRVRPDAIFIQSESAEQYHASSPRAWAEAKRRNAERFLSLDLNYGHQIEAPMYEHLMDNGMTPEEYAAFQTTDLKRHCVLGTDYYVTNEHLVLEDCSTRASGDVYGYATIIQQYYARYHLPLMHTETNLADDLHGSSTDWLWKQWANLLLLWETPVPVLGFTWFSLTDQVDWDTALRENNGRVNSVGLYDLDRKPRQVGRAYKRLISQWQDVLPARSLCLRLPLVAINSERVA